MKIGLMGLGRMGGGMTERLTAAGHEVCGWSRSAQTRREGVLRGAIEAPTVPDLISMLQPPRILWLMLPAGQVIDDMLDEVIPLMDSGDIIVDGGNSYYQDTIRRAAVLREKGFAMVDCGTSGGVWGATEGYSLMIGAEPETVQYMRPLFEALAPAPDRGWGHVGPNGAGHFVKMVHNGIEYGMMQAYAEGYAVMEKKSEFALDLHQISRIWQHGSVVRSWLLDLIADALKSGTSLDDIRPWVEDSGEGRWTVAEAIALDLPAPVITHALLQRLGSRDERKYAERLLAVMRKQFGGHAVQRQEGGDESQDD